MATDISKELDLIKRSMDQLNKKVDQVNYKQDRLENSQISQSKTLDNLYLCVVGEEKYGQAGLVKKVHENTKEIKHLKDLKNRGIGIVTVLSVIGAALVEFFKSKIFN